MLEELSRGRAAQRRAEQDRRPLTLPAPLSHAPDRLRKTDEFGELDRGRV